MPFLLHILYFYNHPLALGAMVTIYRRKGGSKHEQQQQELAQDHKLGDRAGARSALSHPVLCLTKPPQLSEGHTLRQVPDAKFHISLSFREGPEDQSRIAIIKQRTNIFQMSRRRARQKAPESQLLKHCFSFFPPNLSGLEGLVPCV